MFQELAKQHGMGMKSEGPGASVLGQKPGSAALLSGVTLGKSLNLGDCVFSPIKREDGAHFQGRLCEGIHDYRGSRTANAPRSWPLVTLLTGSSGAWRESGAPARMKQQEENDHRAEFTILLCT